MDEEFVDDVRDNVDEILLQDAITESLKTLPARGMIVLKGRFWLDMTLEEVANDLGISRERVRQIESKAIRQLRHPSRLKLIINYRPQWLERFLELREIDRKKQEILHEGKIKKREERYAKIAEQAREREKAKWEEKINAPHEWLCPNNVVLEFSHDGIPYLATHWWDGYFNRNMDQITYDRWLAQRLEEHKVNA